MNVSSFLFTFNTLSSFFFFLRLNFLGERWFPSSEKDGAQEVEGVAEEFQVSVIRNSFTN